MKKLFIETYGCQMNVADSEVVASIMKMAGYELCDGVDDADAVFLNTCSVRENAENKIYHRLDTLYNIYRNRGKRVILGVLGCMAERVKEGLITDHHADLVAGPDAYLSLPGLIAQCEMGQKAIDTELSMTETYRDVMPLRSHGPRLSGFVSIMRGCNNFCHYCIVPYTRGRERSRDVESILAECRDLAERGYKELTLLGQNVNSYGKDLDTPYDFADLLAAIDAIPGEYWIRFMSSQPKDATHKLFDTMARCGHVCKQLHLPVQSGNDRVLRAMNRPYSRAGYLSLIGYARSVMPGLVLTSDVIIGFPGETESEAMDTVSLVEEAKFDALFTFIFSPRPGTPAAGMVDPVPREEKQKWFDRLVAVQNAYSAEKHASYIGKTVRVLVDGESDDPDWPLSCRTEGNRLVRIRGDKALIGTFADVTIQNSNTWALYGEAVK